MRGAQRSACRPASWSGPTRCCCPRSPAPDSADPRRRPVRHRGAAAAGAVRHAWPSRSTTACMWSLSINTLFYVLGSLSRASMPLERIQAAIFVPRDASPMPSLRRFRTAVTVNDLKDTIGALSRRRAHRALVPDLRGEQRRQARRQRAGRAWTLIRFSEQLLASAVGSSSARLILSLLFQRHDKSLEGRLPPARRRHRGAAAQPRPAADRARPDGAGHHRLRQGFPADLLEPAVPRAVRPARRDGPGRRLARPHPAPPRRARRHRATTRSSRCSTG